MRVFLKNAAALSIAGLALLASMMAVGRLSYAPPTDYYTDPGIHLAYQDGQVVVALVDAGSRGQMDGVVPGWVVAQLNGEDVLDDPVERKQSIGTYPPEIDWIWLIDRSHVTDATAMLRGESTSGDTIGQQFSYRTATGYQPPVDVGPIALGIAVLFIGWWILRSGRAGARLRRYAVTLPVATVTPLLLVGLDQYPSVWTKGAESILLVAGALPLALDFAADVGQQRWRARIRFGVFVAGAAVLGGSVIWFFTYAGSPSWLASLRDDFLPGAGATRFLVVALISLVPGLLAAQPTGFAGIFRNRTEAAGLPDDAVPPDTAGPPPGRRPFESTDLALAAITPAISGLTLLWYEHPIWPIVVWVAGVFLAARFQAPALQRLEQLASRTTHQRDLVVSATERERARIAGDIHDYALQDLTMLVRRLDSAGDQENAAAAREVADRLRAICGDLRLPILDDLGVGPALDWLVGRLESDSTKLDLELFDREQRLTADAELAFFRVAQEAIANAINHATPPVMVRYWGGGDWAELTVDDCGSGISNGAAEAAERSGHMGLMSMSQRAEAIGAELTFGRRPGGGARIHMTWERKAGEAERATDPVPAPSIETSGPAGASPEPA